MWFIYLILALVALEVVLMVYEWWTGLPSIYIIDETSRKWLTPNCRFSDDLNNGVKFHFYSPKKNRILQRAKDIYSFDDSVKLKYKRMVIPRTEFAMKPVMDTKKSSKKDA